MWSSQVAPIETKSHSHPTSNQLPPTPPPTPSPTTPVQPHVTTHTPARPHVTTPTQSPAKPQDLSLLPLVILSLSEIEALTSNAPVLLEHQLPWLLNVILETTKHCL